MTSNIMSFPVKLTPQMHYQTLNEQISFTEKKEQISFTEKKELQKSDIKIQSWFFSHTNSDSI